jgi:hypothetical protein
MSQVLAPPKNALAVAGFTLGCVAVSCGLFVPFSIPPLLLLVIVPALLVFVFVPAVLAIIFGFVGIRTANRLGGKRKRLAVWAVVLGFSPLPVWFIAQLFFAVLFGVSR